MIISVKNLSRQFRVRVREPGLAQSFKALVAPKWRTVDAVAGINFEVEEGETLAFLGPNGAGKSTTIKMLTGILRRSGGEASVLGYDPGRQRRELSWHVGTVFGQKSQLWYHLPAGDSFRLLGAVYEVAEADLARRTGELKERFALGDFWDVPVRKLSLGQRIRCEIAASLLHRPRILFLDEPTIGLDVVAKQEVRTLLQEWNRDHKVTLFLTSHDLGDVEKLCRRALVIHHGTLVLDETVKNLKHQASAKKIIGVRYADPVDIKLPGLEATKKTADSARFDVDTREHSLAAVLGQLGALGPVADITVEDEPLENLMADLFRSTSKEDAHGRLANR